MRKMLNSKLLFMKLINVTVTKAGVPTNKIFVGESSYGRSFKMAQAGCTGPDCKFLGDRLNSQAKKGRCTGTAGYIANAELNEILSLEDNVQSWHDGASNSDIIVYEGKVFCPLQRDYICSGMLMRVKILSGLRT